MRNGANRRNTGPHDATPRVEELRGEHSVARSHRYASIVEALLIDYLKREELVTNQQDLEWKESQLSFSLISDYSLPLI